MLDASGVTRATKTCLSNFSNGYSVKRDLISCKIREIGGEEKNS